jgi:intein-encoded DNA endonuclease-like protein
MFSEEQLDFLKNNYDKMSYKDIGDVLGFTERQIRGKINGIGLTKLRKFDNNYFNNIESPNQAYWLGFIYADGYIISNNKNRNYELGIELKDTDIMLLKDFNNELGGVHNISLKHSKKDFNGYEYETVSCVIRIYSKTIVDDLNNLNIYQNKTNISAFPVCDDYFFDFLRGFNDGDGCISVNKRNRIRLQFVNSNLEFLEYLHASIKSKLNIDGSIYKEKEKKYQLAYFRQSDVKIILDKLYENSNCQLLKRKYEIYKSYYGSPA